ncbi:hypothetical protein IWZ01DRAFT_478548 [Phyllosticta capitalensis]
MPTAADIIKLTGEKITYVGVPLTVLGILPILWNIVKAFTIRYRLSRTIPWELRPFFNISADPANGNVMVYVPELTCVHVNLWPIDIEDAWPISRRMRFKRWSHKTFHGLIAQGELWLHVSRLLKPWQVLLLFFLRPFALIRHGIAYANIYRYIVSNYAELVEIPYALRSTIKILVSEHYSTDACFKMGEAPYLFRPWMIVALKCGLVVRQSEVAKTLGTRCTINMDMAIDKHAPLCMQWRNFVPFALAIGVDPEMLKPTQEKFDLARFDTRTTVLRGSKKGDDWFLHFQSDRWNDYSVTRTLSWLNILYMWPHKKESCQSLGHMDYIQLNSDTFNDRYNYGADPQECRDPLAAALSLRYYEELAIFRDHLDGRDFKDMPQEQSGACRRLRRRIPVSQRLLEALERSLCFLKTLERRGCLEKMVFSVLSLPFTNEPANEGTDREENPGPKILDRLSLAVNQSAYVGRSIRVCEEIRNFIAIVSSDAQSEESIETSKFIKSWTQPLERSLDGPNHSIEEAECDIQKMCPNEKLVRLRSLFDPYSTDPSSTPSATEEMSLKHSPQNMFDEIENMSESAEMTLLAHMVMAGSGWGNLPRRTWEVDSEFNSLLDKLQQDSGDRDAFISTLEEALKYAEGGIYTAPSDKEMVSELINEETDRSVYLY